MNYDAPIVLSNFTEKMNAKDKELTYRTPICFEVFLRVRLMRMIRKSAVRAMDSNSGRDCVDVQ